MYQNTTNESARGGGGVWEDRGHNFPAHISRL